MKKYKVGFTSGVFDMFHIGHLNILLKAKEFCDFLVVAVSTDDLVESYKGKRPVISETERLAIVSHIDVVDLAVFQQTLDKTDAKLKYNADVVFHGNDWRGSELFTKHEETLKKLGVEIVYLPYTQGVSSTLLRDKIGK